MRVVLQRVSRASVTIAGTVVGASGTGFCLLVGFTHGDTPEQVDWMAEKVVGLRYRDRGTEEEHLVELEGIFVQIGLIPNSEWLDGAVALTGRGEIEVDARGATSVPGVFAAGDVTTVPYKQIVIAMGEGSKAALSAFDHLIRSDVMEPA